MENDTSFFGLDQEQEAALNDWKLERIKTTTSPASLIIAAIVEACGSPPQTVTRITEGFSNEVYAIDTTDGQQVVVRIHHASPHFEAEQWALDRCATIGIPTPRFLLLSHSGSETAARSICVETRLPGQTLYTLMNKGVLNTVDAASIVRDAGSLLARVHTIPTTGWGRIDATGAGQVARWSDLLDTSIIDGAYQAAHKLAISPQTITEAIHYLQTHASLFTTFSPRLLHGDFSPQQILVDAGRITGFIDFEFPLSGDPAWEFAYWDYFTGQQPYQGSMLPTEWLLEGYRQSLPPDPTFDLRIALWRLELGLGLMDYHRHDQVPDYFLFIGKHFLRSLEAMCTIERE